MAGFTFERAVAVVTGGAGGIGQALAARLSGMRRLLTRFAR